MSKVGLSCLGHAIPGIDIPYTPSYHSVSLLTNMGCIGLWGVTEFVLTRPTEIYHFLSVSPPVRAKNKRKSSPTMHFGLSEVFGGLFISLRGVVGFVMSRLIKIYHFCHFRHQGELKILKILPKNLPWGGIL